MSNQSAHTLRLILGDQLNAAHSWYRQRDDGVVYVIAELAQETGYVKHHVQKVCAFFSAMERFAHALDQAGHRVCHLTLDDSAKDDDLPALLERLAIEHGAGHIDYQRPDEYRLLEQLREFSRDSNYGVTEWDTEHFLLPFETLAKEFRPDKTRRMEHFYRKMRKRFDVLMEDGEPLGGQWNYDADNRHALTREDLEALPRPLCFANDVGPVLKRLKRHQVTTFGEAHEHLLWPVSRAQSRELLAFFVRHCLPLFGRFQDAMTGASEHRWSLYHSRLSFAMNSKMLHPREVIDAAIEAYHQSDDAIDLAQVEGFVRQVLGWREYVRGVYWVNMPDYAGRNYLEADTPLPDYFWTGKTRMNCMAQCLGQSLEVAYAHHIQRLMVIGNFSLLAGLDPDAVDAWYLGVYVDAIEWVEMPNTRGMSQFADGGLIASKPYCASGRYIQRMSDYCSDCYYKVGDKTGERACPFNSLYWDFLNRHRVRFERNPRMRLVYNNWDRQPRQQRQQVLEKARDYRRALNLV